MKKYNLGSNLCEHFPFVVIFFYNFKNSQFNKNTIRLWFRRPLYKKPHIITIIVSTINKNFEHGINIDTVLEQDFVWHSHSYTGHYRSKLAFLVWKEKENA